MIEIGSAELARKFRNDKLAQLLLLEKEQVDRGLVTRARIYDLL